METLAIYKVVTSDDASSEPRCSPSSSSPYSSSPSGSGPGRKQSKVHVSDEDATPQHDAENDYIGLTPEEREKHRKFEELRKKHYEMRGVARFLGHPEDLDDIVDDEEPPEMPTINGAKVRAGD